MNTNKTHFNILFDDKAVMCRSEEAAMEFLIEASKYGYRHGILSKGNLPLNPNWERYGKYTCYFVNTCDGSVTYSDAIYAAEKRTPIVMYKGFISDDMGRKIYYG